AHPRCLHSFPTRRSSDLVQEREDEESDDRNAAQEVPPERRVEDRLQRGASAQRELGEDVRNFEEAPREQEVPVGDDQFRQLRTRSEEHTSELQSLAYLVC